MSQSTRKEMEQGDYQGDLQGDFQGEWTTVSRRKTTNKNLTVASSSRVATYIPYKPLYSRVVSSLNTSSKQLHTIPISLPLKAKPSMAAPSPPSSPPPTQASYYFSPHSPTKLRFPPSSTFTEWRGRCFRCCRTGHNSAAC